MNHLERNSVGRASTWLIVLFAALLVPAGIHPASGQRFSNIRQAEDTLSYVLSMLNRTHSDSLREKLNQDFADALEGALNLSAADGYPFDSLKSLVKVSSPDNKFRIFHWNLPSEDGRHRYRGFLKVINHEPPLVYPLVDKSDSFPFPDTVLLDNTTWFGALYYKVIPGETSGGLRFYTLLGWSGENSVITRKVIDILFFDDQERPHFGYKIFPDYQDGRMTRVIFRFSASTSMSLKYEVLPVASARKWNEKKREFEYTWLDEPMIVFDRLVPLDSQLTGQFQFYVTSGELSDGFMFKHNAWNFMPGIETRNKK